jgi:predicted CXXCH cytochrome family protein
MGYNLYKNMRKLLLVISIIALSSTYAVSAETIPELKKNCFLCHMLNKKGTKIRLTVPINELCLDCHPDRKKPAEHEVDIRPSMRVRHLPLYNGKITCVTCHEPHGMTGLVKMLRAMPSELCSYCHAK